MYPQIDIQAIKEGDQQAFRRFVDLYAKDLYFFALGYVEVREVAEEVVMDVFVKVWDNRFQLDTIKSLKAWLLTMTRNQAILYLRKSNQEKNISFEEIEDYQVPFVQSPDLEMISKQEIEEINSAIASLSPKCKEVFILAKIEKVPYKEIAEMLGISVKTINNHVAKAVEKIASVLKRSIFTLFL